MKNNIISIYCKDYIDIIRLDQVICTSYDKKLKIFDIYLKDYSFTYTAKNFKNEVDFMNTIIKVNRLIRKYMEEQYV